MKTLSIRGLPDEVHSRLKTRAKQNRRSLNQEVIAELSRIEDLNLLDETERKQQRAEEVIAKVDAMRSRMKRFLTAEEIDAAIEEGRR